MNIQDVNLYRYKLPLKSTLTFNGQSLDHREGVIIRLTNADGSVGLGDIAPLPGYSEETLQETIEELQSLVDVIFQWPIVDHIAELSGEFERWLGQFELSPSVRFGIESAVLNLFAQTPGGDFAVNRRDIRPAQIANHALLSGSHDMVMNAAAGYLEQGFLSFKLKVGTSVADDVRLVQDLNALFAGKAVLHVDANQSWSLDEAVAFGRQITCAAVEYIEEPCRKFEDLDDFYQQTMIPIALDETLRTKTFEDIQSIEGVDVIVLKPTLMGGIELVSHWLDQAERFAIRPIISSSFESDVGLRMLLKLSSTIAHVQGMGLGTVHWLERRLVMDDVPWMNAKIPVISDPVGWSEMNDDLLESMT
jgi:O-succinylbenzoate synthase